MKALKGGGGDLLSLGDALVEMGAGWIQEMVTPKAYGVLQVTYHEGRGGDLKGTITYSRTRTKEESESGTVGSAERPFEAHLYESFSRDFSIQLTDSEFRDQSQEMVYTLRAMAQVVYRDEIQQERYWKTSGCRTGTLAHNEERTLTLKQGEGTGPAEFQLTVANNGRYSGTVRELPKAKGTMQYDHFRSTKGTCSMDVEKQDSRTDEEEIDVGSGGVTFSGQADPQHPDLFKGRVEHEDAFGYTTILTWDLRLER